MAILFCSDSDPPDAWREVLVAAFPRMPFRVWPDPGRPEDIRYALVWRQPHGLLARLPNLKAVLVLGAGVDSVLDDPQIPDGVPVLRLVEAGMAAPMAEYALLGVLAFQRGLHTYLDRQHAVEWKREPWSPAADWPVGVMGLGVIGAAVARRLAQSGYPVAGWVREDRRIEAVEVFAGRERLGAFLARSRVVVNVLPLTPATRGILDAQAFACMPRGSYVINIGRGAHVADEDLVAALDAGRLGGAMLDVFREEPLPQSHAFWRHPKIVVTPHAAAPTVLEAAATQIVDNIARLERGEPPLGLVDRQRGY
ncbi:MAG TPA: glyoxylate/hydroxypyruvate reductase A [Burkholderiales bacterium]|nr:glyoxylate/hydroxypyruvate reductase A [Burkholderiales bacterium]